MDMELLLKFFEVNELIKNEVKRQKGGDAKHKKAGARLSMNAKNTLRILHNSEEINQRTLAKKLNISAQAMSEIIKNLEQGQYIERKNNRVNNENIISITNEGRKKAKMFIEWFSVVNEKVFSILNDDEKIVFDKLLDKIKEVNNTNEYA